MTQSRVPVVVLNTHHSGLGIARDLGPYGVRVIGVTSDRSFPGNASRWVEFRCMPDSLLESNQLLDGLKALSDEIGSRSILFPTRDHDVNFINANRDALEERFVIPFASPDVVTAVMDKSRLARLAEEVGIKVPAGLEIRSRAELESAAGLAFPVVCKPAFASQWRRPGIWQVVGQQKAVKLESRAALLSFYTALESLDPRVVVQEWIEGDDSDLEIFGSWCGKDHEVGAFFTARKRIQYPELIGTGISVEAVPLPKLEVPSRRLLHALRYYGISEIEYKRDRRTGQLYLIEINPRHWDQHRLGSAVGVNLSKVAYDELCGIPRTPVTQSDKRVFWVAEPEFLRHAARVICGRASAKGFFPTLFGTKSYATIDRSDPAPVWRALRSFFRRPPGPMEQIEKQDLRGTGMSDASKGSM